MKILRTQFFLIMVGMIMGTCPLSVQAKTYFTPKQAEKICFPSADKFEWKTHRYSMEEIKAIYHDSRLKVIDPGIWYGVAYKDNKVIGVLAFDRCIGKHEYIDYVVALTPAGEVKQVEILNYRESWGYEVRREGWRKQFIGKNAVAKIDLNDGIHNISGATLSCRGITRGVKRVCHTWGLVLHPALVAGGHLPKPTAKD
jgi:Na+-translocating ferredoxin:NAD+ oxidoreductase RnfG subunit